MAYKQYFLSQHVFGGSHVSMVESFIHLLCYCTIKQLCLEPDIQYVAIVFIVLQQQVLLKSRTLIHLIIDPTHI